MTRLLFASLLLLLPLRGQDPVEILRLSIERDGGSNERVKNYTCVQTLEAKFYAITKAGDKALAEETRRWQRMSALVDKLLAEGA